MQNEFWRYFNLADCSLQHMKLCSFIILVAFKFGVMDQICQIKVIAKISAYTVVTHANFYASPPTVPSILFFDVIVDKAHTISFTTSYIR